MTSFFSVIRDELIAAGFEIVVIDLSGIVSSQEMFDRIVSHIPCDPSYIDLHPEDVINGAALEDSLWGGLMPHDDLALLFCDADKLISDHMNLFLNLYKNIAYIAAAKRLEFRKGRVKLFLFVQGNNFAINKDEKLLSLE